MNGQSSYGHLVLLADHIVRLRPDVVIFLMGVNDVGHAAPTSYDHQTVDEGLRWTSPKGFLKSLAQHSYVAAMALNTLRNAEAWQLGLRIGQVVPPLPGNADSVRTEVLQDDPALIRSLLAPLDEYRARVENLVLMSQANGILPILVTQPYRGGDAAQDATYLGLWGVTARGGWQVLDAYNDVLREVAAERTIPLVDLAHQLGHDPAYFTDMVHFTNIGASAVAAWVADSVRAPLGQIKGPR